MRSNSKQNNNLTFNELCYELLLKIPKGRVTSYKAIAQALNCKAYQAVGNAMNQNPNPVSVPCHRVVNSDGRLGGYAFGSNHKIELLTKEGIVIQDGKIIDFDHVFFDFID
ncbi:MGMT family protein [Thiomicrorhabdus lithotrophica]|uniref:MGMT family protein n=1 Tax=Thiomicrorhabdus lithotrophica TaxID=2949997 RepID=A0ABY8CBR4_9GAMM|nr:MGMT family protein [Thiomicrorhabdus lithotrophica]WEJ63419.1 MGMT family protein [Thiomicrorhabdus lithotrophica]